jgi:hypothetical protein
MNKIAHKALATVMLLAGCATMDPRSGPPPGAVTCTRGGSDICVVTVTVNSCNSISANPDVAWVPPTDAGDIVWKVAGRWKFVANGIVFRNPHSDFSNPRGGNSQEFRWNNAHRDKNKPHKYTIHVTDGTQVCSHDPTIMN